ncbi:hypothetical protein [Trinickia acidisoli]|uniref:hypothetical protein n=1 Tax=Trinickia acidisoli TaxID=2767482 RepID=UPI001A8F0587|nr:hypothetical protein [Trinickia acidisoli]
MDAVKSINVAGATIVVQTCMLFIVTLGVVCAPTVWGKRHLRKSTSYFITLLLALISVLIVAFTKDFYQVWSPILGDLRMPTMSSSTGLLMVFSFDIFVVAVLMLGTGGSKDSPFTSILFMLPALAIFLREPPHRFFSYAFAVVLIYIFGLHYAWASPDILGHSIDRAYGEPPRVATGATSSFAHGIVNIACLGVAMLTGYITRPLPI